MAVAAEQHGWIMHVHAVGDRAVREALNGFEYARSLKPAAVPHSISHLQLVNPKEFARFKQLGVIASMQLLWATAETYTEELVKPYVSAAAYQYQYPARSLHQAGATIAGASVVAQVLLAMRKTENWVLWIAIDVLSIWVYLDRALYLTAGLYVAFLVLATMGLIAWALVAGVALVAVRITGI